MSKFSIGFRLAASHTDRKRDRGLTDSASVTAYDDIAYAPGGSSHKLDLYVPKGTGGKLPVIVSVHGGGYVYGSKKVYRYYGMFLAEQGFAVVNFNYRLAPEVKFPAQLTDINMVLQWIVENAGRYPLDPEQIFFVGDSAGAQLAAHYCAIYSNPAFAEKFPFSVPKGIHIRAAAFNCGMYDISAEGRKELLRIQEKVGMDASTVFDDYLGKNKEALEEQLAFVPQITSDFPPSFIMTSQYDFLREAAEPMKELLEQRGVTAEYRLYGEKGQKYMGHVFHVNMHLEEAKECNREECAFFRRFCSAG